MLNVWSLSVVSLVFLGPDDLDAVLAHQTAHTPVADVQPQFLQFFGHPWPPIALQAKPMLLTDVGEKYHIISLPLAHWAYPPRTKPTRCDLHDTAEKLYGPSFLPGVDES